MSSAATKIRFTPQEYLALERKSQTRNEYYNGEIFAMAGASREHNLISVNLLRDIGNQLEDRPCETYPSDMRVSIEATGLYTYPDVSVVCGEPRFQDARWTHCSTRRSSSRFSHQRPRPTIGVSSSATTVASVRFGNSF